MKGLLILFFFINFSFADQDVSFAFDNDYEEYYTEANVYAGTGIALCAFITFCFLTEGSHYNHKICKQIQRLNRKVMKEFQELPD